MSGAILLRDHSACRNSIVNLIEIRDRSTDPTRPKDSSSLFSLKLALTGTRDDGRLHGTIEGARQILKIV
jgi:hypothetical protein